MSNYNFKEIGTTPPPNAIVTICGGLVLKFYTEKYPNFLSRFIMRWLLGWEWERINKQ